ncbi:MAG: rRNA maturation RNase YbeY [Verrucomicrobiota bacterium]
MKDLATGLPELIVQNRQRMVPVNLGWLRKVAAFALPLCAEHSADGLFTLKELDEVVVTIVSDKRIAEIHMDFMGIPGATDVITFQHGEVVISAETALRYAKENGQLPMAELALYMVHGFLHLNAHEDGTELQRTRMHAVQDVIWRQALDALPV